MDFGAAGQGLGPGMFGVQMVFQPADELHGALGEGFPDSCFPSRGSGSRCHSVATHTIAGVNAGSLDLIIATLSIHHNAELITFDADYLAIARVSKLHVNHLSRNPL
jgi:hypothetical protein